MGVSLEIHHKDKPIGCLCLWFSEPSSMTSIAKSTDEALRTMRSCAHNLLMLLTVGPTYVWLVTALLVRRGRRAAQLAQRKQEAAAEVGLDHQTTHRMEHAPLLVERGLGGGHGSGAGSPSSAMQVLVQVLVFCFVVMRFRMLLCRGIRATRRHSMSACLRL